VVTMPVHPALAGAGDHAHYQGPRTGAQPGGRALHQQFLLQRLFEQQGVVRCRETLLGRGRSRPCRAHSSSSIRRAVAQTFGTGLGAVAVLPAGVHRGRSETVGPTTPGRPAALPLHRQKPSSATASGAAVSGRPDRSGRGRGGFSWPRPANPTGVPTLSPFTKEDFDEFQTCRRVCSGALACGGMIVTCTR